MIEARLNSAPSIITLDDDLAMHAVYDQLTQRLSVEHICFDTIEDTLNYLRAPNSPPEVLIIDRLLPDGDGLDFATFARARIPELSETQFILVSGAKTDSEDPRLVDAGIKHFLEKPFKVRDLSALICKMLPLQSPSLTPLDNSFVKAAFTDDLLRLSLELLHASRSSNADPVRILHSIQGIAGMLEREQLRADAARLIALSGALNKAEHLPQILHIVQQCEAVAQRLTEGKQAKPTKVTG